jgi:hypothetical protein
MKKESQLPAVPDFAAEEEYTDEAVRTLLSVMRSKKAKYSARISVAFQLLDYTYGKPPVQVRPPGGRGE